MLSLPALYRPTYTSTHTLIKTSFGIPWLKCTFSTGRTWRNLNAIKERILRISVSKKPTTTEKPKISHAYWFCYIPSVILLGFQNIPLMEVTASYFVHHPHNKWVQNSINDSKFFTTYAFTHLYPASIADSRSGGEKILHLLSRTQPKISLPNSKEGSR